MGRTLQEQLVDVRDHIPVANNKGLEQVQEEEPSSHGEGSEGEDVVKPVRRRERRASNDQIRVERELEECELTQAQKDQLFAAQLRRVEADIVRAQEEARQHRSEKFINRSIGGSLLMMATGALAVIAQALISDNGK